MPLVSLENVTKTYDGVRALDGVSLAVDSGEFVSIMGSSGSGKTTMLNLIGCLDTPSNGAIHVDDAVITSLSERDLARIRREKIGLVFQQFHLIPHLTAVENVMLAQYYHSLPDRSEAREALKRVGLSHRLDHYPNQLSGGEQQRVCIARALINYPALILADEPTGNLDEKNEHVVMDIFRDLHREGHTIIIVTHDRHISEDTQRSIILEHGRLV